MQKGKKSEMRVSDNGTTETIETSAETLMKVKDISTTGKLG